MIVDGTGSAKSPGSSTIPAVACIASMSSSTSIWTGGRNLFDTLGHEEVHRLHVPLSQDQPRWLAVPRSDPCDRTFVLQLDQARRRVERHSRARGIGKTGKSLEVSGRPENMATEPPRCEKALRSTVLLQRACGREISGCYGARNIAGVRAGRHAGQRFRALEPALAPDRRSCCAVGHSNNRG